MRSLADRVEWRLGTRGIALVLLGIMWIGRGMVIAHDPGAVVAGQSILHLYLPVWFRVALWCVTGLVAIVVARSNRWQRLGWAAVIIAPAERAASYLWSLIMWIVPGHPDGTGWSVFYVAWWVANVALLIHMAARWKETSPARLRRLQADGD